MSDTLPSFPPIVPPIGVWTSQPEIQMKDRQATLDEIDGGPEAPDARGETAADDEASEPEDESADNEPEEGDADEPSASRPKPKPPAAAGAGKADENIADLPAWAQREIRRARNEAQNVRRRSAEEIQRTKEESVETLRRALGLTEDEAADPETLIAAAEEKSQKAAREARNAVTELAVFKASGTLGADAEALLDSRAFVRNLEDLDPSEDDFPARVADLIQEAVEQTPSKYRKAPSAAPANTDGKPVGGDRKPAGEQSVDELRKARQNRRSL